MESRTKTVAKLALGIAIGYGLTVAVMRTSHAQAIAPAGAPSGVIWTNGGRAAGGPITVPGQDVLIYNYPNPAFQPYTLNPGAGWSMGGLAAGAAGVMLGQPLVGGIVGGSLTAVGSQVDKTRPPLTASIVAATVVGVGGGGSGSAGAGYAPVVANVSGIAAGSTQSFTGKGVSPRTQRGR